MTESGLNAELEVADGIGIEDAFYRELFFSTGDLRIIIGVHTGWINVYVVVKTIRGLMNYLDESANVP